MYIRRLCGEMACLLGHGVHICGVYALGQGIQVSVILLDMMV